MEGGDGDIETVGSGVVICIDGVGESMDEMDRESNAVAENSAIVDVGKSNSVPLG